MQPDTDTSAPDQQSKEPAEQSPRDAMHNLTEQLIELKEYAGHYFSAHLDLIKHSLSKLALNWAVVLVGIVTGAALLVTGVVLLCVGLGSGLGVLFGVPWLGNVV